MQFRYLERLEKVYFRRRIVIITIWQGSREVNPYILIFFFLIGIMPNRYICFCFWLLFNKPTTTLREMGSGRLIELSVPWVFHHHVNFLGNMELLPDNHDKHVFECFYHPSPSISDSNLPSPFPKHRDFEWPLNRCKENRKALIWVTERWPRPLNRGVLLTGVLFTLF